MTHGNRSALLDGFSMKRLIHQGLLMAQGVRIVSYPRSGRTWLRLMLHDASADPQFTHVGSKNFLQFGPDEICQGMGKYHRRQPYEIPFHTDIINTNIIATIKKTAF